MRSPYRNKKSRPFIKNSSKKIPICSLKTPNPHLAMPKFFPGSSNPSKKVSKIEKSLQEYTVVPTNEVQKKMDYFFTPYNRSLPYEKYMKFDSDGEEWKEITDFILDNDKDTFR